MCIGWEKLKGHVLFNKFSLTCTVMDGLLLR